MVELLFATRTETQFRAYALQAMISTTLAASQVDVASSSLMPVSVGLLMLVLVSGLLAVAWARLKKRQREKEAVAEAEAQRQLAEEAMAEQMQSEQENRFLSLYGF